MSRILEAVYNTQRHADDSKVNLESGTGHLTKVIDKGNDSMVSAMADWLSLATQMDPNANGRTMVEMRLSYPITNLCNLHHQQLYGNRTIEEAQLEQKLEFTNNAFCSFQNLRVRQNQWENVKDEEDGMQGPSAQKDQAFLNFEEAQLWNNVCMANYRAATALFEEIFAEPFVYKPYDQKPRTIAGGANAARLAAERRAQLAQRQAAPSSMSAR